jgi:hypothetical protein
VKSILRAFAKRNFLGKIRGALSPYKILVSVLFLLCALYTGKGIVSLNGSLDDWRTILNAFVPACLSFVILVYFLIPKNMNVPLASLIPSTSQISLREMGIAGALSVIFAVVIFPLLQLGFTRLMLFIIGVGGCFISVWVLWSGKEWGLALLPLSIPFLMKAETDYFNRFLLPLFGYDYFQYFTLSPVVLVVLFASNLMRQAFSRERIIFSPITIALLAYGVASAVSILLSFGTAGRWAILYLEVGVGLMISHLALSNTRSLRAIFYSLCGVIGSVVIWAFFFHFLMAREKEVGYMGLSAYELGFSPNDVAMLLLLCLPVAIGFFLATKKSRTRGLWGIVVLWLVVALYLTSRRHAWLGASFGLALFILLYDGLRRHLALTTLVGLIIILATGILSYASLVMESNLSISIDNYTREIIMGRGVVVNRFLQWRAALLMFMSHPFSGVGVGLFREFYANYGPPLILTQASHAHNMYLSVLAERGALGFVAMFSVLFLICHQAVRALRATMGKEYRPIVVGCVAGLGGFFATYLVDGDVLMASGPFLLTAVASWSIVACLVTIERIPQSETGGRT